MLTIRRVLLNAVQTQLLLSIMALPILIHWGLPMSAMTLLGNLIFTPILTIMLVIASLIFFSELLYLPNIWLTNLLDMLVYAWNNSLHLGSSGWMLGFPHPGIPALGLIPITTIMFLTSRWAKSIEQRVFGMSILLILSCAGLWTYAYVKKPVNLHEELFSLSYDDRQQLSFIDYGYFNRKATPDKGVEFDLKPFITKQLGTPTINHLQLTKTSQRSFLGALALCENYKVNKLTIPYWKKNKDSRKLCWAYGKLKRYALQHKIPIDREEGHEKIHKNIFHNQHKHLSPMVHEST